MFGMIYHLRNWGNPKEIKPKVYLFLFICLNLLIDLIPNSIGMNAAWMCASNKIEKNKINSQTKFILNLSTKTNSKLSEERNVPLPNNNK